MQKALPLIIGISGASGAIYGIRALQLLRQCAVPGHLVMSKAARLTIHSETGYRPEQVEALAEVAYPAADIGARIASGSFATRGMLVAPCSVKTLAEVASGVTTSLLGRAADVVLKERRRLVLMVRETPLTHIHLRNMQDVTAAGGIIMPPVPAFYAKPASLEEMVDFTLGRALALFDIDTGTAEAWQGLRHGRDA